MEQESMRGKHSKPSSLSVFAYPPCCPIFLMFFLAPVFASEWPAALPSPLSPQEQTAPCQMDFLYTMPHCVLALFLDTFGGLKKKNNNKKQKRKLAMSRRFLKITVSPCWEDSTGERSWICDTHTKWMSATTVNIFVFLCFTRGCASLLQHRGQLPLLNSAARVSNTDSTLPYQVQRGWHKTTTAVKTHRGPPENCYKYKRTTGACAL